MYVCFCFSSGRKQLSRRKRSDKYWPWELTLDGIGVSVLPLVEHGVALEHESQPVAQLVHAELDEVDLGELEEVGAVHLLVVEVARVFGEADRSQPQHYVVGRVHCQHIGALRRRQH